MSKVFRPGHLEQINELNSTGLTDAQNITREKNLNQNYHSPDDFGWKKVGKKGKVSKAYNIPVQNKYEIMLEEDKSGDLIQNLTPFQCAECNMKISTKNHVKKIT